MKPPVRVRIAKSYLKSRGKIGGAIAERADASIRKLVSAPNSPGLNFEPFKNRPGYFTIRVGRNFRILLREDSDEQGQFFWVLDLADHDDTYS